MDILQEGPELLPHCDQCGIQMLVARIFKAQAYGQVKQGDREKALEERCGYTRKVWGNRVHCGRGRGR